MDEIRTGVDDLMALLTEGVRISIPDVAKKLKQTEGAVQNWVDFLVEEKLVGIEYKFTTPYIYRNAPQQKHSLKETKKESIELFRTQFIEHANEKNIPKEKIAELWEHHLLTAIQQKQAFFKQECLKRNLLTVEELFERYTDRVTKEYGLRHLA